MIDDKQTTFKGLCQCGCGQKTNIIKHTCQKDGRIKGAPSNFLSGHNGYLKKNIDMIKRISEKGKLSHNWKGGEAISPNGYVLSYNPTEGRVSKYIPKHILVAEKVLGKKLPDKAVVHHFDGNKLNNERKNLIICQDNGYHLFLHKRKRAFEAGGVRMIRCSICKKHDLPENLQIVKGGL